MAFQGSLRELPLPDVIQLVAVSGKTGAFLLESGPGRGKIYLEKGRIVHAEAGGLSGEEAIYELATWTDGEFKFDSSDVTDQETIAKSNTNLLMEAARRVDEWRVLSKKVPSIHHIPAYIELPDDRSVSFSPNQWRVVRRIDENRSIDEISSDLGWSSFDTAKIVYGLVTSGIIELRSAS